MLCAFWRALANAGSRRPAQKAMRNTAAVTDEVMIPARARPEPDNLPALCLIRLRAMIPRTRPTGADTQINTPATPQTSEAMASPLVGGGFAGKRDGEAQNTANSGTWPSGNHSDDETDRTNVR